MLSTMAAHAVLLEAAYDFTTEDEAAWLEGVARGFHAALPKNGLRGIHASIYRLSGPSGLSFERTLNIEWKDLPPPAAVDETMKANTAQAPSRIADIVRTQPVAWIGDFLSDRWSEYAQFRRMTGVADTLAVNGIANNGFGCGVQLHYDRRIALSPGRRDMLARVAPHLLAALQVRRAMVRGKGEASRTEAVLEARARAEGAPSEPGAMRDALRQDVLAVERTRSGTSPEDAQDAGWPALIGGQWSLLDRFERDGRRYIVACCNAPEMAPHEWLTPRERQVVALAARGHANKAIAYELGIAPSTVGVLLGRAAGKCGVRTRRALIHAFSRVERVRDS